MPLYDFECFDCHQLSELLVSSSRTPICPHCGSRKLEKQLPAFAMKNDSSSNHVHSAGCGCGHSQRQCCGGHCAH
ncbi:MAG: zinc ribbon domain-containing protein [Puniceicoccales bacterium]|nr:zinc ribbon domain-containing protein [Puniceicoccales bacterium]